MFKRVSALSFALFFALAVFVPAVNVSAAVDTCTWTGATSNLWSVGTNWSGCDNGGVPESGDSLIFPAGASNINPMNNDIAGLNLNAVTISGAGYVISGNALTITPTGVTTLTMTGANNIWSINTTLDGTSASPTLRSQAVNNAIGGTITLANAAARTFSFSVSTGHSLQMGAAISGSALNVTTSTAGGTLRLSANNSFTATNTLQLNEHIVICEAVSCLGNSANDVELYNGAELRMDISGVFANDIVFAASTATLSSQDQTMTISGNITISSAVSAIINPGSSAPMLLNGTFTNGGTANYGGSAEVVQNGSISGGGNVVSNHTLTLVNANTYTGSTIVNNGGRINAMDANSFGSTTGGTFVSSGGSIIISPFGGPITIAENISVAGNGDTGTDGAIELFDANDNVTFSGTVTLTGSTIFANALASAGTANMFFSGVIGGTGNITLTGVANAGSIQFTGASPNTYVGTTIVSGVRFFPSKNAANIVAVPGNLEIRAVGALAGHAETSFSESIANTSNVTLVNDGATKATLAIGSTATETVNSITGDGDLILGHGSRLLTGSSTNFSFAGRLGKFSSFTPDPTYLGQIGTGTLTFTGSANTVDYGSARVDLRSAGGGTIVVNGASLSDTTVVVENGGTLKGTSPIGSATVLSGGNVNVGNSPGCMTMASLTLNSGSIFTQEIAGSTACTQYDQTTVTGTATLGNATLSVVPAYTPASGTVFTIITAGSVTGTFNALADGATLTASGLTFRVNYTATAVTLTYLSGTLTSGSLADTGVSPILAIAVGLLIVFSTLVINRRHFAAERTTDKK